MDLLVAVGSSESQVMAPCLKRAGRGSARKCKVASAHKPGQSRRTKRVRAAARREWIIDLKIYIVRYIVKRILCRYREWTSAPRGDHVSSSSRDAVHCIKVPCGGLGDPLGDRASRARCVNIYTARLLGREVSAIPSWFPGGNSIGGRSPGQLILTINRSCHEVLRAGWIASEAEPTFHRRIYMQNGDARNSGSFMVGGDIKIHRLGFGAMRITGKGIWGPPKNRAEAVRTLKRLPELGVNFIDTADSYGPEISETLIQEALAPYKDILIATKAGLTRQGPDRWAPNGKPEYLIQRAKESRARLGLEQIGLWQLHRIDPKIPMDEQFHAVKTLLDDGVIAHAGLSEVSVDQITAASKVFKVATVQNRYNLVDRTSEAVLDYCERHAIGFIPWFPLAAGDLAKRGSLLDRVAQKHGVSPSQIALAWVLKRSPVMLPIPGTSQVKHLEENVAAANITLDDAEYLELNKAGMAQFQRG